MVDAAVSERIVSPGQSRRLPDSAFLLFVLHFRFVPVVYLDFGENIISKLKTIVRIDTSFYVVRPQIRAIAV